MAEHAPEDPTERAPGDITSDYRFAPIPEGMLFDTELSDGAVRVYGILARHGSDAQRCFPSKARLIELTGKSRATITRLINELVKTGWIERVERHRGDGGQSSNGYHLRTGAHVTDDRGPMSRVSRQEREQGNESNLTETPYSPPLPAVADSFDQWWELYPRKVSKKNARQAWARAIKRGADQAELIDDIEARAVIWGTWPKVDHQFIPHPTTFLNGDRWDDPMPQARRSQFDGHQSEAERILSL